MVCIVWCIWWVAADTPRLPHAAPLLQERNTASITDVPGRYPVCHFFNSFFMSKLYMFHKKYDYKAVRRWTRPDKLERAGQVRDWRDA